VGEENRTLHQSNRRSIHSEITMNFVAMCFMALWTFTITPEIFLHQIWNLWDLPVSSWAIYSNIMSLVNHQQSTTKFRILQ